MGPAQNRKLNRRDFMRGGAVLAGTAYLFSGELSEVIANSVTKGPKLTSSKLNQDFAQARTAGTLRSLAANIKLSPIGWLHANYSITEVQSAAIKSISETHWQEIKRVLSFVEGKRGASLTVSIQESVRTGPSTGSARKCIATIRLMSEAQVGTETIKAEAEARTT